MIYTSNFKSVIHRGSLFFAACGELLKIEIENICKKQFVFIL
jgi:hypothetical protein